MTLLLNRPQRAPRRTTAGGSQRPFSMQDADFSRHEAPERLLSPTRARSPLLGKPLTRHSSVPVPRVHLTNIDEDSSSVKDEVFPPFAQSRRKHWNIDEDSSSKDEAFLPSAPRRHRTADDALADSKDAAYRRGRPLLRASQSFDDPLSALDEDVDGAIEAVVVRRRSSSVTGSSLV